MQLYWNTKYLQNCISIKRAGTASACTIQLRKTNGWTDAGIGCRAWAGSENNFVPRNLTSLPEMTRTCCSFNAGTGDQEYLHHWSRSCFSGFIACSFASLNHQRMQKAILSGAVPSSIFSPEYIATKQTGPNILSKFFSWCAAQKLFS